MCTFDKMLSELKGVANKTLPHGGHVYLYGSRARGDSHESSDWDVLILLNKDKISQEDFDNIAYPMVEAGWNLDEVVSPQIYTFGDWKRMSFMPYYKNVEHDKIVIV